MRFQSGNGLSSRYSWLTSPLRKLSRGELCPGKTWWFASHRAFLMESIINGKWDEIGVPPDVEGKHLKDVDMSRVCLLACAQGIMEQI
jgi:hypothetical protein